MQKKLSEYMREGAQLHPYLRSGDFVGKIKLPTGELVCGTDPLGAAYEAATGELPPPLFDWRNKKWNDEAARAQVYKALGIDQKVRVPHPDIARAELNLVEFCTALKNKGQTREQIADALAALGH